MRHNTKDLTNLGDLHPVTRCPSCSSSYLRRVVAAQAGLSINRSSLWTLTLECMMGNCDWNTSVANVRMGA